MAKVKQKAMSSVAAVKKVPLNGIIIYSGPFDIRLLGPVDLVDMKMVPRSADLREYTKGVSAHIFVPEGDIVKVKDQPHFLVGGAVFYWAPLLLRSVNANGWDVWKDGRMHMK